MITSRVRFDVDLFQGLAIFGYTIGRFIRQVNSRNAILWDYAIRLGGRFCRIISKTLPGTTTNHVIFEVLRMTGRPGGGPPFPARGPSHSAPARQKRTRHPEPPVRLASLAQGRLRRQRISKYVA